MDLEDCLARTETWKCESAKKAERMAGPRWPPAPIMRTFLIVEVISKGFGDTTKRLDLKLKSCSIRYERLIFFLCSLLKYIEVVRLGLLRTFAFPRKSKYEYMI